MARSDFLRTLFGQAKEIEHLFSSAGGDWLTEVIAKGENEAGDRLGTDRIYELICYFSLIVHLTKTITLEYVPGKGNDGYRFPHGPGDKENFAFFRFNRNQTTYDLCSGTHVFNKYKGKEHPDISLQNQEDSTDKSPGKPVAIWDAKCYGKPLTKDSFFTLRSWLELLNVNHFLKQEILSDIMPQAFRVNALITNVKANVLKQNYKQWLLDIGFSVVYEYDGNNPDCEPEPTIDDHQKHTADKTA